MADWRARRYTSACASRKSDGYWKCDRASRRGPRPTLSSINRAARHARASARSSWHFCSASTEASTRSQLPAKEVERADEMHLVPAVVDLVAESVVPPPDAPSVAVREE